MRTVSRTILYKGWPPLCLRGVRYRLLSESVFRSCGSFSQINDFIPYHSLKLILGNKGLPTVGDYFLFFQCIYIPLLPVTQSPSSQPLTHEVCKLSPLFLIPATLPQVEGACSSLLPPMGRYRQEVWWRSQKGRRGQGIHPGSVELVSKPASDSLADVPPPSAPPFPHLLKRN